jgi:hypothetical protein
MTNSSPAAGIPAADTCWAPRSLLDPAGATRTKALGSERMARRLGDALPDGESLMRASVWELMRPMLSPALVALQRDAFVIQDACETTVDLAGRHAASSLDDLDELDGQPRSAQKRRSLPAR